MRDRVRSVRSGCVGIVCPGGLESQITMNREKRIAELTRLIKSEEISVENGATPQLDDNGNTKVQMSTCGNCGMSWNDALITGTTPAPSGRCPYEYIHAEIKELKRLERLELARSR